MVGTGLYLSFFLLLILNFTLSITLLTQSLRIQRHYQFSDLSPHGSHLREHSAGLHRLMLMPLRILLYKTIDRIRRSLGLAPSWSHPSVLGKKNINIVPQRFYLFQNSFLTLLWILLLILYPQCITSNFNLCTNKYKKSYYRTIVCLASILVRETIVLFLF